METVRQVLAACEQGNCIVVQNFLDQGAEVDGNDEEEITPLQVAAANGHEDVVRLLLMRGAALDKTNVYGWTALMQAARHGHTNVVALLIQNKAEINMKNKLGASALTLSARGGHLATVRKLIEAGIELNSSGSQCEFNPLMAASLHGCDPVVRLLLDRGSEVNYHMPFSGLTALMLASLNGHKTTTQILVERGCDPNLLNICDKTALDIANMRGKREVNEYLDRKTTLRPKTDTTDIKPDIIEAAKVGDIKRIAEILEEDISQRDACHPADGATPLMFAAMTGRLDIADLLVELGADMNKQDTISGWTALMQATFHGKKALAKYLIDAGADVNIQALNGCTAFDLASLIDDSDMELVQLLASVAIQISRPYHFGKAGALAWQTKSSSTSALNTVTGEPSRKGLKAWWNRMSNRFRNLKLGRTFRLAPLPSEDISVSTTSTMTTNLSIRKSSTLDPIGRRSDIDNFETILTDTAKGSIYTLGVQPPHSKLASETLKPVIPPFFPPPSYELNTADRPCMPAGTRSSANPNLGSGPGRPLRASKFLFGSTNTVAAISTSPTSPSKSSAFAYKNSSPQSSGGAQGLHSAGLGIPSSSSSSTLTAGSDNLNKSGSSQSYSGVDHFPLLQSYQMNRRDILRLPASDLIRSTSTPMLMSISTSPNNSINDNSSFLIRNPVSPKGQTVISKSNTINPSLILRGLEEPYSHVIFKENNCNDDDLSALLRKLALERYQPIFEEQEVDMEAFLTLTDQDLKELGIKHPEPRNQILSAIQELNSGKGRERQQYRMTLNHFRSPRLSAAGSQDDLKWTIQEESPQIMVKECKSSVS